MRGDRLKPVASSRSVVDVDYCNQKLGHLGPCSLDANITETEQAEPGEYEDPFDTYTAFNPDMVQVLHKPNFHWSKTVHAKTLNSMSKARIHARILMLVVRQTSEKPT